ncbi:hypothetical protein U1Q18_031763 [Sarracenia purpurea var. burkii]
MNEGHYKLAKRTADPARAKNDSPAAPDRSAGTDSEPENDVTGKDEPVSFVVGCVVVGANLCERVSDFGFYVGDDLGSRVRDLDSKIACHGYALALINGGIVHSRDAVPPGSAIVYSDRPDLVSPILLPHLSSEVWIEFLAKGVVLACLGDMSECKARKGEYGLKGLSRCNEGPELVGAESVSRSVIFPGRQRKKGRFRRLIHSGLPQILFAVFPFRYAIYFPYGIGDWSFLVNECESH